MVGKCWKTTKTRLGIEQTLIVFLVASYVLVIPKLQAPSMGGISLMLAHSGNK